MSENQQKSLKEPLDLTHHFSRDAKRRLPSFIKGFYKYFLIPGIAQLAGGVPDSTYFPFDTLEARVAVPDRFKPTPNHPVDPPSTEAIASTSDTTTTRPAAHLLVPHDAPTKDPLRKIDLATALQYGTAQGYPPLYQFVREFTRQILFRDFQYASGPEIILTCGSTDGFSKAVTLLTNEWTEGRDPIDERPGLLCEEFCYTNAIQTASPRGTNIVPVAIDDEGMMADGKGGLRDVLENWDFKRGRRPHLIYTVTVGQNPTSGVLSVKRRHAIYSLCQKYDIILIEDDPYWYLQYPSANPSKFSALTADKYPRPSTGYPFLDSLVPSYLSLDVDGRVLRLDTFSKTVAPGCRLGWITAQPSFIEKLQRITETSTQQPSGFVQSMVAELVLGPPSNHPGDDAGRGGTPDGFGWRAQGWIRWLEGLRGNYERRMNVMCSILEEGRELVKTGRRPSLSQDVMDETTDEWSVVEKSPIYDFSWPMGGMFVWLSVRLSSHPLAGKVAVPRLSRALWISWTLAPYKVLVSPGNLFSPTAELREADNSARFFRVCFAAVPEGELRDITKRFVDGVQAFWRIKDTKVIDRIIREDEEGDSQSSTVPLADVAQLTGLC